MREKDGAQRKRNPAAAFLEMAILFGAPVLFHFLLPLTQVVHGLWRLAGIALMVLGLWLTGSASREFRKAKTGFQLRDGGAALVTSGPFRFSRNPIYLGMLVWLLGLAVLLGSLVSFVFPVLTFLLANFVLIPPEEKKLQEIYGDEFRNYRQTVRRWL